MARLAARTAGRPSAPRTGRPAAAPRPPRPERRASDPAGGRPRAARTRGSTAVRGVRLVAPGVLALPGRMLDAPFGRAARARTGSMLDALLRGRAWIALVGVLLVGIVFFNVDLLRLNRQLALTTEDAASVARDNARLRLELSRLDSSERIQRTAAARGLVLPAAGLVRYLRARPSVDGRAAARRVTTPRPPSSAAPSGAAGPAAPETSSPGQGSAPTPQRVPTTPSG
jgi:hypothetical protein